MNNKNTEDNQESLFKLNFPQFSRAELKHGFKKDLYGNLNRLLETKNEQLLVKHIYLEGLMYTTQLCLTWKKTALEFPTPIQINLLASVVGEILEETFPEFNKEWSQKIVQFVPFKLMIPGVEHEVAQYYNI